MPEVQFLETGIQDLDEKARILVDNKRYEDLVFLYLRACNKLDDDEASLDLRRIVKRNELLASAIRYIDMVKDFQIPMSDYVINYGCSTSDDEGCPYSSRLQFLSFEEYFSNCDKYPCENCTATYRKYFCSFIIGPK